MVSGGRASAVRSLISAIGKEVMRDVKNLEGHAGVRSVAPAPGDRVSRAKAAIAVVRIFGAFLVVVGVALLVASLLQGLSGN